MAKQKFDKEDYRVLMGDKPKVKVVLLSPKNVMDYSIRVSATIDQNRGGSGAAAINAARVKMYKIFFTRLAEEVDGGKVRITAQRSEIFFVMYRSAMKMKRDAWLKSIKATIKSAIAQVYADLKAELNPKAAQKPSVGASKAAPRGKEIIAALKKIGINAKVITNARTGEMTIEIAVVETAAAKKGDPAKVESELSPGTTLANEYPDAGTVVASLNAKAKTKVTVWDYYAWQGEDIAYEFGGTYDRFEKAVAKALGNKFEEISDHPAFSSVVDFIFGPKKGKGGKLTVGGYQFKDLDKLL